MTNNSTPAGDLGATPVLRAPQFSPADINKAVHITQERLQNARTTIIGAFEAYKTSHPAQANAIAQAQANILNRMDQATNDLILVINAGTLKPIELAIMGDKGLTEVLRKVERGLNGENVDLAAIVAEAGSILDAGYFNGSKVPPTGHNSWLSFMVDADKPLSEGYDALTSWINETIGLSDESRDRLDKIGKMGYRAGARGVKTFYEFGTWAAGDKHGRDLLAFGAGAAAFMLATPILNWTGLGKLPIVGPLLKFGIGALIALVAYAKVQDMINNNVDADADTKQTMLESANRQIQVATAKIDLNNNGERLDKIAEKLSTDAADKVASRLAVKSGNASGESSADIDQSITAVFKNAGHAIDVAKAPISVDATMAVGRVANAGLKIYDPDNNLNEELSNQISNLEHTMRHGMAAQRGGNGFAPTKGNDMLASSDILPISGTREAVDNASRNVISLQAVRPENNGPDLRVA